MERIVLRGSVPTLDTRRRSHARTAIRRESPDTRRMRSYDRKREPDRGSLADRASHIHRAAVGFDYLLHYEEAQTGAVRHFPCPGEPSERLEEHLLILRRDADPHVGDAESHPGIRACADL